MIYVLEFNDFEEYFEEYVRPICGVSWDGNDEIRPSITGSTIPLSAIDDPHRLAESFRLIRTTETGQFTLWRHRDNWYGWDGNSYDLVANSDIKNEFVAHTKREFDNDWLFKHGSGSKNENDTVELEAAEKKEQDPPPVRKVGSGVIGNGVAALESIAHIPAKIEQPAWIGEDPPPFDPRAIFATSTGLIDIRALIDGGESIVVTPTPEFFSCNSVAYGFAPEAECNEWIRFLHSIWKDDTESIAALQEWFGYCLLPDTSLHTMLLLIGPPRSGKGTIAHILTELIGRGNVAQPTLSGMSGEFGLATILGKLLAIFPDCRLSKGIDSAIALERILSIVGEDPLDVNRKHLQQLVGVQFPTRFFMLANELPAFLDPSGALLSRTLMISMQQTFVGREDRQLRNRLLPELPGILNWAIAGLERLQQHTRFHQPDSGKERLTAFKQMLSPVSSFLDECCIRAPRLETPVSALFAAWATWRSETGDGPGSTSTFGKDLASAVPSLRTVKRRRADDRRERVYVGIGLKKVSKSSGPVRSMDLTTADGIQEIERMCFK